MDQEASSSPNDLNAIRPMTKVFLRKVVRWAEKRRWEVDFEEGKLHKGMD